MMQAPVSGVHLKNMPCQVIEVMIRKFAALPEAVPALNDGDFRGNIG
jgi:hypothetical protein